MRTFFPVVLALLPVLAGAQEPYFPRFARAERPPELMEAGLFCIKPEWPKQSFMRSEEGATTVRITVAPTGRVLAAEVAKSSGFELLDKAAIKGPQLCSYRPASIDGKPVQGVMTTQYVWTLR